MSHLNVDFGQREWNCAYCNHSPVNGGWRWGEPGVPIEDALWRWSLPDPELPDNGCGRSGLNWVCPMCPDDFNVVCATTHPWTTCPGCGKTMRADLPWNIDCTAPEPDEMTRYFTETCIEDYERARTILAQATR